MFSKFFINRPIFATVLALLIVVAGLVTLGILPIAHYAAYRSGQRRLSGCQRADSGTNRGYPH